VTITLNHITVAVNDRQRGARFITELIGLPPARPAGPFMAVAVNDELTLDFDDRHAANPGHYAFLVDDATFDRILDAADALGAAYGSGPERGWDGNTYNTGDGRGIYVQDPDGHNYEFFTSIGPSLATKRETLRQSPQHGGTEA
jgi:catechol 2,3-dioxygenase-like lactoylglutathione lyase family enzyme